MKNSARNILLALTLGLILCGELAHAAEHFTVQGLLDTASGQHVIDGNYPMRISLRDAQTTAVIWSKRMISVPVTGGVFTAVLQGNDDSNNRLVDVFHSAPIFVSTSARDLTMDVELDLDNDGVYEDAFRGLPVSSVPHAMISDRTYGVMDGSILTNSMADGAVSTDKIADGAVTFAKIAGTGASTGDVVQWNGTAWVAAAPATGGAGGGGAPTGAASGDLAGLYPSPTLATTGSDGWHLRQSYG